MWSIWHTLSEGVDRREAIPIVPKASHDTGYTVYLPPIIREVTRRRSRISARGGRQGIDDLIWDGDERFFSYANTDLQLFKMFIAIVAFVIR